MSEYVHKVPLPGGEVLFFAPDCIHLRVRRRRIFSLFGPRRRPLFSERNRVGCRVLPLGRGWRVVVRREAA